MGADVFQGAQDVGWNGGRSGQVVAHRMVALLVGRVGQRDVLALGRHIGHGTAGAVGIARLLDLDAIAGLEGIVVVALGIGRVDVLAGDHGILVDVIRMDIGQHQGGEEAERLKRLHDHDLNPSGLTESTH